MIYRCDYNPSDLPILATSLTGLTDLKLLTPSNDPGGAVRCPLFTCKQFASLSHLRKLKSLQVSCMVDSLIIYLFDHYHRIMIWSPFNPDQTFCLSPLTTDCLSPPAGWFFYQHGRRSCDCNCSELGWAINIVRCESEPFLPYFSSNYTSWSAGPLPDVKAGASTVSRSVTTYPLTLSTNLSFESLILFGVLKILQMEARTMRG